MRWFGPNDPVTLADIRQAGCSGVVTALHQVPVGEIWTVEDINRRRALIEAAGMRWTVIESLPVSDDIKRRSGRYRQHIAHYRQSLRNVAACGLKVVTYNFMPVLDWLRTDVDYRMPDGSKALYFERLAFVAFDLFLLERPGASAAYSHEEAAAARLYFDGLTTEGRERLFRNVLLGLPGSDEAFTPAQVLAALKSYEGIDAGRLRDNLFLFLQEVVPVAEACGLSMAIHPDDPPYPVLGLPRIVSTEEDIAAIIHAVPSPANGLCYCTGSLGARADNDVLRILRRFGDQIHFLHLRNTKRDENGNFFEAPHLEGDTDMYAVVKEIVQLQRRRNTAIPMRPDHGHQMLDDLRKRTYPGYSAIGRLKGLAELRGLETGIRRWMDEAG
ncbi:mannonate dehydratase [Chitinophaga sp. XS-30]|uniref:mannonate dehydratase n=1 Tax=Chitinophaga sp. XS-30 TaxID=2604421 RepID=UPI001FEDA761|nr:mannonate dehydratase [Chitinophaga sp. XS-30]